MICVLQVNTEDRLNAPSHTGEIDVIHDRQGTIS